MITALVRLSIMVLTGSYDRVHIGEIDNIAVSIASGRGFADAYAPGTGPTTHYTPAQPLLIAACYALFGIDSDGELARQLQRLLFSCLLFGALPWIALRFGLSARAGLFAGLLGAALPLHVLQELRGSGAILDSIFIAALCVVTFPYWRRAAQNDESLLPDPNRSTEPRPQGIGSSPSRAAGFQESPDGPPRATQNHEDAPRHSEPRPSGSGRHWPSEELLPQSESVARESIGSAQAGQVRPETAAERSQSPGRSEFVVRDSSEGPQAAQDQSESAAHASAGSRFGVAGGLCHGLLIGLACLFNPVVAAVAAGLGIYAFLRFPAGRRNIAVHYATAAAVTFACLLPWGLYNYSRMDRFVLTRGNLPLEMSLSFHPKAEPLLKTAWTVPGAYPHPSADPSASERVRQLGEAAFMEERKQQAVAFIKENPGRVARLVAQRFFYFWFPDNGRLTQNAGFWLLTLAALAGLGVLIRRRESALPVFGVILTFYPMVYYLQMADTQYRLTIYWVFLLLSGVLVDSCLSLLARQQDAEETVNSI